eukprot:NODE_97_length_21155_cov_0.234850.p12 type:complete len:197 gc:universal NODE_97_length_21155_cov_0.234850:1158-1748(+)
MSNIDSKVPELLKRVSNWSNNTASEVMTECAKNELLVPNTHNLSATTLYEKLIDGYLDHPGHNVSTLTTMLSILISFYSHNSTPNKYYYIGLYLLVLLANKQSSDYYAMIDTIPPKDILENTYIDYCMQIHFAIEQGSFAQLHALLNGPSPHYQSLLKMILETLQYLLLTQETYFKNGKRYLSTFKRSIGCSHVIL